ncbi:MAG: FAD-dependent oxidoreductase [Clostridia bacterium]|nr:FAD-dependent oxidoreductase [Clostridia bacterium]
MKKLVALVLACLLVTAVSSAFALTSGTYEATVAAMHGPMTVQVTVDEDSITDVQVTANVETPGLIDWPLKEIPAAIVANQTTEVDTVTGATFSSRAIIRGVREALKLAGATDEDFAAKIEKAPAEDQDLTADVIIVGGGGAGLAASISATEAGASVILIEKTGFFGGNSIVSGGIFNCPDPDLQDYADITSSLDSLIEEALAEEPVSELHAELQATVREQFEAYKQTDKHVFDSAEWMALQTWNGGDKVADLDHVIFYAQNAYPTLKWLESMGMEFAPVINSASGSLYMRTHTAVMPNGTGYFKAFQTRLADKTDLWTPLMNTTAESLITDETGRVTGVNAVGKEGNKVTLHANKGVILATGGFAGNVEMRMEYCVSDKWPDLSAKVITTNMPGVTGDGLRMAQEVGAELINMDQIQLLPYANPWTGATSDITLTYSASCYINKNGERFVREDGRRDEMSLAIIAQPDGLMYQLFSADAVPDPATGKTLGDKTVSYYLDNHLAGYVQADTLEGLAEILGMDPAVLQATVDDMNACVRGEKTDDYGRVTWTKELKTGPWYAYPRKPAAHHTMGGVNIDLSTHALRADGSVIEGLYCAGEITGNFHGANRLGGNAIVDFCVFGRIAGENAAEGK